MACVMNISALGHKQHRTVTASFATRGAACRCWLLQLWSCTSFLFQPLCPMDQPSGSPAAVVPDIPDPDIKHERPPNGSLEQEHLIEKIHQEIHEDKSATSGAAALSSSSDELPVEPVTLDFDPQSVMEWSAGVGKLPGSNLKFKQVGNGLEMIDDDEAVKIQVQKPLADADTPASEEQNDHVIPPVISPASSAPAVDEQMRTCVHCSKTGPLANFIRAGKFCSQDCATSHASQLKSLVKSLEVNFYDGHRNGKGGLKPDARGRNLDIRSPQAEKRKHNIHEESPAMGKNRKSGVDDENDENNRSRPQSLLSNKVKGGRKIAKNRVKELRNEETTSLIDSEKLSLPSSPSSSLVHITPQSALHQSIFSMRVLQHQQEPPLEWDRHSKNLLPVLNGIRAPDVLSWDSEKVAAFVNSIPGCRDIGQTFSEELIDGEAFLLLNQQDIVKVLNIKLGPAVKIYNAIILIRDAIEL